MKYDYFCALNQQTIEVEHGMNENLATWGELCALAGISLADTPADTPVSRIISGGTLAVRSKFASPFREGPDKLDCCMGGSCKHSPKG